MLLCQIVCVCLNTVRVWLKCSTHICRAANNRVRASHASDDVALSHGIVYVLSNGIGVKQSVNKLLKL